MPHLDAITIASFIAVAALGLMRLLTTAKPIWDKFPPLLQGIAPALVLVLPQIAEQAAGVKTGLDLTNLLVLAAALILPGVHSHTVALKPPSGPGSAGGLMLIFALSLSVGFACSGRSVAWPKVLNCADALEQPLVGAVAEVLAGTGDVKTELENIALTKGASVVECAVQQIVSDLGTAPVTARASRQVVRGRAFLASVQQ